MLSCASPGCAKSKRLVSSKSAARIATQKSFPSFRTTNPRGYSGASCTQETCFIIIRMEIRRGARRFACGVLCLFAAIVVWTVYGHAQQRNRFLYAALPGVGGGNNMKYGGAGILVFDIDNGHKFVKRIPLQGEPAQPVDSTASGRGGRGGQESIKGIAAHAPTARLYVSTRRRVAAYDLLTDKLVWEQSYDGRGTDRIALSPDGTTIYAPVLGAPKWIIANATSGEQIGSIDKPGRPHNTQFSDD